MNTSTAIITGGAGAIGRAIAKGFLEDGIKVALFDNRCDDLKETETEFTTSFGSENVMSCCGDIRSTEHIDKGFGQVLSKFGQLDILVNNAAVTAIKAVDAVTDGDIDEIIDVDLKGYIKCARCAVAEMKRSGRGGSILMISSKNGLEGASEKSLYSAAKGGILTLSRALARELGPFNIRVNSICPDAVITDSYIWRKGGGYLEATLKRYNLKREQLEHYYRQRCALKMSIYPEDVAAAALFLVSEAARAITGAILPVDGGVAFPR